MKHLTVVAAILIYNEHILCAQRSAAKYEYISFKYEFPGGKLEPGENPKEALHRELIEEMDLDIPLDSMIYFHTINHQYPDFKITMESYICNIASRNVNSKEHVAIQWLDLKSLRSLDWAEADIPIVEKLVERGF